MIKLTDRLQVLADQIEQNETMADIGTDHGFLPIALWERGICPHVILTDVSAGSLKKAEINAKELYPHMTFDLRLGNGIGILKAGEVDSIVIAGMGGILMTQILGEDLDKTKSFSKFILQPRSGQGKLRYWLLHHGFTILQESLVREGKYICEVLTVSPAGNHQGISGEIPQWKQDDIAYEVPPWILTAGDLAEEFIRNRLAAEKRVMEGLAKSSSANEDKKQETEKRIDYLMSLLGGVKKV